MRASSERSTKRRRRRQPTWHSDEIVLASLTVALALAGGIAYVVVPTTKMWWIGLLAALPLLVFIIHRADKHGQQAKDSEHFPDDGGPWWSP